MTKKFIVIIYAAPPATRGDGACMSYSTQTNPQVKRVTATAPQAAADTVNVPAGGYALVIEEKDARRFDRARQAPLVESHADGSALPRAMGASRAAA